MTILKIASSAAAAIMFISFLVYSNSNTESQVIAQAEHIKEYSVPTLILNNGNTISISDIEMTTKISDNIDGIISDNKLTYNIDSKQDSLIYNKLIVPSQSTYSVVLSDGTEVTLNANSTFTYPVEFNGDTRSVELSGEAYFNVTKSDKPFIVNMGDERVQVYGTQFNIKNQKSRNTTVILVEGSVGYSSSKIRNVMMTPNQMLSADYGKSDVELSEIDPFDYIAWQQNLFSFEKQTVYSILADISSWYGIEFRYENLNNKKLYSFIMSRNVSVLEILRQISSKTGLIIIREGKEVYTIK